MAFTDSIPTIDYQLLVRWVDLDALAENDEYMRTSLLGYRRPRLTYQSATTIDVENNTGTQHQTKIVFPDMDVRSVTENTGSTTKYRRFDITATASFASAPEESGLRSGLSEAANTWYAIYAVKSQVDAAKFVLAGDTTLPLQTNYSTLNTRYGSNGWIYLGMIRNGNNDDATTDILDFVMSGNYTRFKNTYNDAGVGAMIGIFLTSGAAPNYTATFGTGTTDIPDHCEIVEYGAGQPDDQSWAVANDAGTQFSMARRYGSGITNNWINGFYTKMVAADGFSEIVINTTLTLAGFQDRVLGIGFNGRI